jgi:hypothetical protein
MASPSFTIATRRLKNAPIRSDVTPNVASKNTATRGIINAML